VVLIGKKSGNDKVQKHVEDCIGWLNAYFSDVGHVTYVHMPDICVAREMGKLPYWYVELPPHTHTQTFFFLHILKIYVQWT